MKEFEQYYTPKKNILYQRYLFYKRDQKEGESFDSFLTELKKLVKDAEFGNQQDSILRDRIVFGILNKTLQEKLIKLRDEDVVLEKTVEYCRVSETTTTKLPILQGSVIDDKTYTKVSKHEISALTEANAVQDTDEITTTWKGDEVKDPGNSQAQSNGNLPMQNLGKVKFYPPKVPVLFVLGGPGSGKVTHCDTLMQEKRGVTHINMMDLLQQYAMGNNMQDFSQLSSKTVTEVLMLEIKMAPAAKAYLISGYPRSMRDVVEYTEKIQVINGVILISWRQAVLQKQIDYGAKLGHVVLSLAKMELDNFFKNVMPVADYFDQSDMLIAVNGERSPSEVYKDFRTAVLDILGAQENQEALLNGVAGMGRGRDDIPGSIVSVETAPGYSKNMRNDIQNQQPFEAETIEVNKFMGQNVINTNNSNNNNNINTNNISSNNLAVVQPTAQTFSKAIRNVPQDRKIICVIGGPGSNKAALCLKAANNHPEWGHISVGRLLRTIATSNPKPNSEDYLVKQAITDGEMVSKNSLDKVLDTALHQLSDKRGVIIDGFPRDLGQAQYFQKKFNKLPTVILLDCSKLQLGRGRLDDTVSSFRRRLELFRELTLPMLKKMDTDNQLSIVDGDTDSPSVQREFEKIIDSIIKKMDAQSEPKHNDNRAHPQANTRHETDAVIQDLESIPAVIPKTLYENNINSNNNNPITHNNSNFVNNNINNNNSAIKSTMNGHIPNGRPSFRNLLQESENFHIDSHI